MATFDLTSKDTTGVSSDSIVAMPSSKNTNVMRNIEAYLDIDALVAAGGSFLRWRCISGVRDPCKYFSTKCRCRSNESIYFKLYS